MMRAILRERLLVAGLALLLLLALAGVMASDEAVIVAP